MKNPTKQKKCTGIFIMPMHAIALSSGGRLPPVSGEGERKFILNLVTKALSLSYHRIIFYYPLRLKLY